MDEKELKNICILSWNKNLLYYDKQKSQKLFSVLELEFPKGLNNFDSSDIIHWSDHIVKDNDSVEKKEY